MTGSELVRGERTDLNGPYLAGELLSLGIEPARVTIVGDLPEELEPALRDALAAELCVVTGGLGPTHDDRTVELVARVTGRPLVVDPELEREIGEISRSFAKRLGRPYAEYSTGVRKQASLPEGALSLGLAGTAPGILLEHDRAIVVVLPGPPRELRRLWPRAIETPAFRALLARARPPQRRTLRFFGVAESAVAHTLEKAGGDGDGVEATICARDFEIHVDLMVEPGAETRADALEARLVPPLETHLFARDERPVEELVLELLRARGQTLATAESCTGGMVAARLTGVPGSSDVFRGGIVAYADDVKRAELGVPRQTLARHGAVSAETAAAMSRGARDRLGADVAVSVTGIAGPDGGTPEKPVGLVHLHAVAPGGEREARLELSGDRETIRRRATLTALHLVRGLLTQSRHRDV